MKLKQLIEMLQSMYEELPENERDNMEMLGKDLTKLTTIAEDADPAVITFPALVVR